MCTLVVLAAGMGSRFGGLKQMQAVDESGRTLLDYTVANACRVGFDKAVFVIRQEMYSDFYSVVGRRISQSINCSYVFQKQYEFPRRQKPLGTAHALLCCREAVDTPFAVVNADDYYGLQALDLAYRHLVNAQQTQYAMVGYKLYNTVSGNGCVSRGVCKVDGGFLSNIKEVPRIDSNCVVQDGSGVKLPTDTVVSMNLWAFTPDVFGLLSEGYGRFIKTSDLSTAEYQIPTVIAQALESGKATVRVYGTDDKWYGITYREDLSFVRKALSADNAI